MLDFNRIDIIRRLILLITGILIAMRCFSPVEYYKWDAGRYGNRFSLIGAKRILYLQRKRERVRREALPPPTPNLFEKPRELKTTPCVFESELKELRRMQAEGRRKEKEEKIRQEVDEIVDFYAPLVNTAKTVFHCIGIAIIGGVLFYILGDKKKEKD